MGMRVILLLSCLGLALGCLDDMDCELNGVCSSGICLCDDEWEGDSCGVLKLGDPEIAYGGPDIGVTSWGGGPPVRHPSTGKYILFVTEIADGCGLSEWATRSTIVQAVSDRPEGPYHKEKVVIPRESHNAYYVYNHPTGEHLIYHIGMGNATGERPVVYCSGGKTVEKNCDMGPCMDARGGASNASKRSSERAATKHTTTTGRISSLKALEPQDDDDPATRYNWAQYNDPSSAHPCGPASPCGSGQPMIHKAKSLDGPWEAVNIPQVDYGQGPGVDGQWSTGLDNPAPAIRADGSVVMLVKNYPAFTIWVAQADAYDKPYRLVREAGIFSPSRPGSFGSDEFGDEEDPCVWQDRRGNYHGFFHNHRGHAFSRDGIVWEWGTDQSWSGGVLSIPSTGFYGELYDTERPRVWVNPDTQRPELLFFASGGGGQPTSVGEGAIGMTVVRKIGEWSYRVANAADASKHWKGAHKLSGKSEHK